MAATVLALPVIKDSAEKNQLTAVPAVAVTQAENSTEIIKGHIDGYKEQGYTSGQSFRMALGSRLGM